MQETITKEKAVTSVENYLRIRKKSEDICAPLNIEDYVVQPVEEVSPAKWHLAHTSWFFEEFILKPYLPGYKTFDQSFNFLFNSYYEGAGERLLRYKRGNITRPGVQQVYEYRRYVDAGMQQLLNDDLSAALNHLVEVGLNHEQQHQELLITDIKYLLGANPLFPQYQNHELPLSEATGIARFLEVDEGVYEIGHSGDGFCYDNETARHKVYLHAYRLMDRPVTNGEFLEFVETGGYEDYRFWLAEAWDWVKASGRKAPLHYYKQGGCWKQFTMNGLQDVDENAPVTHVNYYEALAYANWKNKRLPTEAEWEVAACQYGHINAAGAHYLDHQIYNPCILHHEGAQFFGNVWEWTGSAYLPYPGFKREAGTLGEYNGKFMINQMVLRGGSCATPADHIRATYRNFFPPGISWQFTGIRLAEDL